MKRLANLVLALVLYMARCAAAVPSIRMNHLQVLHAHNSYHTCPLPNMISLFQSSFGASIFAQLGQDPSALEYSKPDLLTLVSQYGVRSLELDINYDPDGGRYQYRAGPKFAAVVGASTNVTGINGGSAEFGKPGWKIAHILDIDFQASCYNLTTCLGPIANWSSHNPEHSPLYILFQIESWNPNSLGSAATVAQINGILASTVPQLGPPAALSSTPAPNATSLVALQKEVLAIFNKSQIYTPDMFRAEYTDMQARIKGEGWPLASGLQGKVIFKTLASSAYNTLLDQLWPGGKGGTFFKEDSVSGLPYQPPDNNTIFTSLDMSIVTSLNATLLASLGVTNPNARNLTAVQDQAVAKLYYEGLKTLASQGQFMTRANGDIDTVSARQNFYGFSNAAMAGGAHFVHTDFPNSWTSSCWFTSNYTVLLQPIKAGTWNATTMTSVNGTRLQTFEGPILTTSCNPQLAPSNCTTWKDTFDVSEECTCYSQI